MSIEFIKERRGARHLNVASRQQKQIAYFTQSSVQEEITLEYIEEFAQRNYKTSDYFLDWVKTIFRTTNFLSFYKYMRHPLPSSKLINDEIKPQLSRVYFADDSYFKYIIKGKEIETPEELGNGDFENLLFNAILFNHNDIIVHDLEDVNKPYRELVCIDKIVSIESERGVIQRIAYSACTKINEEEVYGYFYADSTSYKFYSRDLEKELINEPHDLGVCPASWVSNEAFTSENDILRKSVFTYVREELEEFVFLKTLLKMTEPNGAIPTTVQLKIPEKEPDGKDQKGLNGQPMTSKEITGQHARIGKQYPTSQNKMMAGTTVYVPIVKDNTGKVNTDIVQEFAKFYYIPIEALTYLNNRIMQLERSIIMNVLGDYMEMNNEIAKNEFQVTKSFTNKQDKLRHLALNMTWTRQNSDFQLLALKYGKENVKVDIFYGSDFYLDNESELYKMLETTPNPIERKNIIQRIGKTKYRFNKPRAERETLLNSLIPFISDKDFDKAVEKQLVTDTSQKLYLQFNYWISMFESQYGDILKFYNNFDASESEKIITIKNLLNNLIKSNKDE